MDGKAAYEGSVCAYITRFLFASSSSQWSADTFLRVFVGTAWKAMKRGRISRSVDLFDFDDLFGFDGSDPHMGIWQQFGPDDHAGWNDLDEDEEGNPIM